MTCTHHWFISFNKAGQQIGACKLCPAVRDFTFKEERGRIGEGIPFYKKAKSRKGGKAKYSRGRVV